MVPSPRGEVLSNSLCFRTSRIQIPDTMNKKILCSLVFAAGALFSTPLLRADDAKLVLAREVIEATQMNKMFDALVPQIQQMTLQMAKGEMASMSPEQKAAFERFQGKAAQVAMEAAKAMLTKLDQVYAEIYSVEELKAMKAFYLSPEGKSMISKQPDVAQRVMPIMQTMQMELGPKIQALAAEFQQEMTALKAPAAGAPAVSLPAVK